jgi:chromosome segregation ATPase
VLRPQKGEGERSQLNIRKRKAPQIILTALIFSTPLCMAQSAMATSFGSLPEQRTQQTLQQMAGLRPVGNYQSQSFQTRFASSTPIISESDISALETRLSQYKSTLATLKSKPARNPSLQATVNEQIATVNQQISDLEDLISQAKKDLADYTAAQETLAKALERYAEAQKNNYMRWFIFQAPRKKGDQIIKEINFEPNEIMLQSLAMKYGNIILVTDEELLKEV